MATNKHVAPSVWAPLYIAVFRAIWFAELAANIGTWFQNVQLVEAMKGQIWVESSGVEGAGSQFWFTLPSASSPDSFAEEYRRAQGDPERSHSKECLSSSSI